MRSQAERCTNGREAAEMTGLQHLQLMSVVEASRRLAISTFTTRRLIKAKQLHAVRVGKRVLISETEIERVIRDGCGKHACELA